MNMVRIARKALLEYMRAPLLLGLIFVFPALLVLLYYVAFGETDGGLARYLKLMGMTTGARLATTSSRRWAASSSKALRCSI